MATESDPMPAGHWFPWHYGNKFRVARLRGDRWQTQEERPTLYRTLGEAQAECRRLNGKRGAT